MDCSPLTMHIERHRNTHYSNMTTESIAICFRAAEEEKFLWPNLWSWWTTKLVTVQFISQKYQNHSRLSEIDANYSSPFGEWDQVDTQGKPGCLWDFQVLLGNYNENNSGHMAFARYSLFPEEMVIAEDVKTKIKIEVHAGWTDGYRFFATKTLK